MNASDIVAIGLCGGVGSSLRYGIEKLINTQTALSQSVAVSIVNVSGCAVAGVFAAHGTRWLGNRVSLVTIGLLGGYTTFSAAVALPYAEHLSGRTRRAACIVVATGLLSVAAFAAGIES